MFAIKICKQSTKLIIRILANESVFTLISRFDRFDYDLCTIKGKSNMISEIS